MLKGNYIDLIIILVLVYFATEAWRHGFWVILVDFISFLGSILISLSFYKYVALFLRSNFSLGSSISNALGFLATAVITEGILGFVLAKFLHKVPEKLREHTLLKIAAMIPAVGEGLILIAFILTLAVAFPLRPSVKSDIVRSRLGGVILAKTVVIEKSVNEIFGGVIEDSLTYLTVKPGSSERVSLPTVSNNLKADTESAKEMFSLVNQERNKLGISELIWNEKIAKISQNYATYMWENHYFGHVSLDGKDVGDRLKEAKINYSAAGENLARAPTVISAEGGLMNSEGHRDNILNTKFTKVGIGVIDNGIYGKIFVQGFTD
ncbi:MAG: CvpA family protein [Candidatus Woesebacteria bacterium]|nr:CvpA family protein [Candidatus Woesebacteria bacterium]